MRSRSIDLVVNSLVLTVMCGLTAAGVMGYLRMARASHGVDIEPPHVVSHPKEVAGLWTRWPDSKADGDPVRFWFFHPEGIGLYRYGKIGLNTTNSFDWRVLDGDTLELRFRKTGEVVRTKFAVKGGDTRSLRMVNDPREPAPVDYVFIPPPAQATFAPDVFDDVGDVPTLEASGKVPGRLWIDQARFATGGMAFSLYQLRDAAIDGRGVGWHHIGDYDDWSTEALTFRYSPSSCKSDGQLELSFTVRGEHAITPAIQKTNGKATDLVLTQDPRSFWQSRTYHDGGPSFGSFALHR
jgi:hypothetical protein